MVDQGKCTFGVKLPLNFNMLNEMIYREVKYFRNYKTYRPNFGSTPVTGKFYAFHDQPVVESDEHIKQLEEYQRSVTLNRARGPRSKYPYPATDNQVYGWEDKLLLPMDRNDPRFYHPRKETKQTKIDIIVRMFSQKKN